MARGAIPITVSTTKGTVLATPVAGDPVNFHYLQNDGTVRVHVKNTNSGSTARTVTIKIAQTVDQQAVTDFTEAIAAGVTQVYGPFPVAIYGTQVNINVDNAELTLVAVQ